MLDLFLKDLQKVFGVSALALGGSYATGNASENSDLDIGIYYHPEHPFSIDEIRVIAKKYAVHDPVVTGFYEWGRWVNGGAWIDTKAGQVDLLYKNIEQINSTIEKAQKGEWEIDWEQQPPYGFSSIIYLGETKVAIPLFDPDGAIEKLKAQVEVYPKALKKSVVQNSFWSAEFSIWQALQFSEKKDLYSAMGCTTRALNNIVTALFALNEYFPIGDKRAIDLLSSLEIHPDGFKSKVEAILSADVDSVQVNLKQLKLLWKESVELTSGEYQSIFNLWE